MLVWSGSCADKSLNRRVGFDDDACERQDLLGERDAALDAVSDRVTLEAALRRLPARGRHVVQRYFFDNRTQNQIATELGTSQMTVSRILAQALAQLRTCLTEDAETIAATDGENSVSAYETEPGCLVAALTDPPATTAAVGAWRDALVRLLVRCRPRTLIVDLRRVRRSAAVARVLIDLYRACGHTGSRLRVVNLSPDLFAVLRTYGVTRLVACRVGTAPIAEGDACRTVQARRGVPPTRTRSGDPGSPAAEPVRAEEHDDAEEERRRARLDHPDVSAFPRPDGAGSDCLRRVRPRATRAAHQRSGAATATAAEAPPPTGPPHRPALPAPRAGGEQPRSRCGVVL
ncbi:MAG: sigma-70 family RNA polymerase sigma factor [Actinomycetota bacterium]|nr:sigma-70 family RNA polymerase sigma factor [Actinomycetota bacterium]